MHSHGFLDRLQQIRLSQYMFPKSCAYSVLLNFRNNSLLGFHADYGKLNYSDFKIAASLIHAIFDNSDEIVHSLEYPGKAQYVSQCAIRSGIGQVLDRNDSFYIKKWVQFQDEDYTCHNRNGYGWKYD